MSTAGELSQRPRELERPGPPPLRIHHLMACAAVAAVQLSLMRAGFPRPVNTTSTLYTCFIGSYQVLSAIGLTVALFTIYWQRRGYAALTQPGQWLLVVYAISAIRQFASLLLTMTLVGPDWQHVLAAGDSTGTLRFIWWINGLVFGTVVPICFYTWCAWRIADTPLWRLLFASLAIMVLLSTPIMYLLLEFLPRTNGQAFAGVRSLISAAPQLILEVAAVVGDLVSGRKRAWTHWTGVGLSMFARILSICFAISFWLGWAD
jgi:hypothetical protein